MTNDDTALRQIDEQLRDNLASAGFTDIKIMPDSFLIRANEKNGKSDDDGHHEIPCKLGALTTLRDR